MQSRKNPSAPVMNWTANNHFLTFDSMTQNTRRGLHCLQLMFWAFSGVVASFFFNNYFVFGMIISACQGFILSCFKCFYWTSWLNLTFNQIFLDDGSHQPSAFHFKLACNAVSLMPSAVLEKFWERFNSLCTFSTEEKVVITTSLNKLTTIMLGALCFL